MSNGDADNCGEEALIAIKTFLRERLPIGMTNPAASSNILAVLFAKPLLPQEFFKFQEGRWCNAEEVKSVLDEFGESMGHHHSLTVPECSTILGELVKGGLVETADDWYWMVGSLVSQCEGIRIENCSWKQ